MSKLAKLNLIEAEETVIIVEFLPDVTVNASAYKLSWKEYPQPWSEAQDKLIHVSSTMSAGVTDKIRVSVDDLLPSTTYCLRLVMIDASGNELGGFSPELIVDTEAVGCTPGQKSSCCVVQ